MADLLVDDIARLLPGCTGRPRGADPGGFDHASARRKT
jgi:hypothetical protein